MLISLNNFYEKTIAIIPARKGSTRIKNKNLKKIGTDSLIKKSLNTCSASGIFDEIIVSTDSKEIENESKELSTLIHRRSSLNSTSTSSTESVILEIFQDYPKLFEKNVLIYLIQCTFPFLKIKDLRESFQLIRNNDKNNCLISGYFLNKFIWEKDSTNQNNWLPKNYDPIKRPRSQESKPFFVENGAFYAFGSSNFKQSNCRIHGKVDVFAMKEIRSIDIDVMEDLDYAIYLSKYLEK